MRTLLVLAALLAPALLAGHASAGHSAVNCTRLHTITTVATGAPWPTAVDQPLASGEVILHYVDYPQLALSDWVYVESGVRPGLQEGRGQYVTDELLGLDADHNDLCPWPALAERDVLVL